MKEHRVLVSAFSGCVVVGIVMFSGVAHSFTAVAVDAQSVTPTPLSLTPVNAPPPQPVPITASNVDRLTLFTAMDMGFANVGLPMWTPDNRVVILKVDTLNTLIPPADSPLELELTPSEKEDQTFGIRELAFSSDGRLIAGGGEFFLTRNVPTGFVQIWDSATGKVLDVVNVVEGGLLSMALSPDGKVLAAGGSDGIRLWQVAQDGKLLPGPTVSDQFPNIMYLVFSPDSQRLAATTFYGVVIYSFTPEQAPPPLQGRSLSPSAIMFSPDGSLLAAVAEELTSDTLVVWDLKTGLQTDLSVPHEGGYSTGRLRCVSFSPDGSLVAAAHGGEVRLWDLSSGQIVAFLQVEAPSDPLDTHVDMLAFSPDGTLLMVADFYHSALWLWGIQ